MPGFKAGFNIFIVDYFIKKNKSGRKSKPCAQLGLV